VVVDVGEVEHVAVQVGLDKRERVVGQELESERTRVNALCPPCVAVQLERVFEIASREKRLIKPSLCVP